MSDLVTVEINGRKVTGDRVTIGKLLLDAGDIYVSEKNGPMRVSDMSSFHLKNAIRKIYIDWINVIFENVNMSTLFENLQNGPATHGQFNVLFKELAKRKFNGTL
jgi:hypothetical protein